MSKFQQIISYVAIAASLSVFPISSMAEEPTLEKARHRLPPVMYTLEMPDEVLPNLSYPFRWSVMGYHDKYDVQIAVYVYDKSSKKLKKLAQKTVEQHPTIVKGFYSWSGKTTTINSKEFFYSTELKLNYEGSQELLIRFFISPVYDEIDNTFLSLIIPGGLGYEPGDSTGRIVKILGLDL
jgi:hypothetical protein